MCGPSENLKYFVKFLKKALKKFEKRSEDHISDKTSATEKGKVGVTLYTQSHGSRRV